MIQSIGITASRHGISEIQRRALTTFLYRARCAGATRFHHGCCVGGDEIGAVLAHNLGYQVIGHPPVLKQWCSPLACGVSNELRESRLYLTRDRNIVSEVDVLIGLPNRPEVWSGSGTWFTVHHAQKVARPRLVMLPDGRVVDQIGVDAFYSLQVGEFAQRGATTDPAIVDGEGA